METLYFFLGGNRLGLVLGFGFWLSSRNDQTNTG